MQNAAERLPAPEKRARPSDLPTESDLELLLADFQKADERKAAKERTEDEEKIASALAELDQALEAALVDLSLKEVRSEIVDSFDDRFEGMKEEGEREADRIFKTLQDKKEDVEAIEASPSKIGPDVMRLGDAHLRRSLTELLRARVIDVVLENYAGYASTRYALFEKPFHEALETMSISTGDSEDGLADALNRTFTPGYAEMSAEAQSALRKAITPMVSGVIESLREKWHQEILTAVKNKIAALRDNQEQLEAEKASLSGKALEAHEASLRKTRQMIDNAHLLLASFEQSDDKAA